MFFTVISSKMRCLWHCRYQER